MATWEIHDWIKGKKARRGRSLARNPETVTVVTPDSVDEFLGARNAPERLEHLRWLRDRGTLVCERKRLGQRVRGVASRCYVFRGGVADVPRIRRERQRGARWI